MSKHDQETQPWPNIANKVQSYLEKRWGGFLLKTHYAWFTGSTVWSLLYGIEPAPDADLDMFIEPPQGMQTRWANAAIQAGEDINGKDCEWMYKHCPSARWIESNLKDHGDYVRINKTGSIGGRRFQTSQGQLDYWICGSDVISQLNNYPVASHGHCKVAFSFYKKALIVMPNVFANEQGAFEMNERLMLETAKGLGK
jgi:hypothetical protein